MEQRTEDATQKKEASAAAILGTEIEEVRKTYRMDWAYWVARSVRYGIDAWFLIWAYRHVHISVVFALAMITVAVEAHSYRLDRQAQCFGDMLDLIWKVVKFKA